MLTSGLRHQKNRQVNVRTMKAKVNTYAEGTFSLGTVVMSASSHTMMKMSGLKHELHECGE
jgi:hypothetical protein